MSGLIQGHKPFSLFIQKPNVGRPQGTVSTAAPAPAPAAKPQQGPSLFADGFTPALARSPQRSPVLDPFSAPALPQAPSLPATAKTSLSVSAGMESSLTVTANGVSVKESAEVEAELKSKPFTVKVAAYSELERSQSTDGDMTTFSVEAEVGVKAEASVETSRVDATASGAVGARGSYQVSVPTTAAAGITSVEQAAVQLSPFAPENLPVGTTIEMHGEAFMETGLSVTFKKIASVLDVTVNESVERAKGMSIAINKVDDKTARVTIGPTEMMSRTNGLSLKVADVEVGLSTTGKVDQQTARQVDFDISTPAGQEAYDRFMATGELPGNDAAKGTSNAATVQVVSGEVSTELTVGISLGENTPVSDAYTYTTYDDGRKEFEYSGQIGPVTLDIAGTVGDPSTQTYAATLSGVNLGSVDGLRQSFGGMTGFGETVTMTWTNEEAQQVQQIARDWVAAHDPEHGIAPYNMRLLGPDQWAMDIANAATPEEAISLMMSPTANGDVGTVANRVGYMSSYLNDIGGGPMPGTVTAK
ncbi:hypothetical protein [Corallococcus terminator]|uniref:Uncharacterized protein n=1 Tax=Corallococcus terminator TaxID=2316733 RepID=A0A3A8JPZ2_9BACT|nr:hypothetical protein [Corallococcus terminator]RKG92511.1 hypothetical protein D7V88_05950 [Corallococcus terminator]